MKTLKTKRLNLRDLRIEDLDRFYAYAKKDAIGPLAGWHPHQSILESKMILNMMISDQDVWAIALKESDELIGTIGLHVRNFDNALLNQKEIGYVLDDPYWGRGFMVEAVGAVLDYAFKSQELAKVLCVHKGFNTQSKRVIEKANFQFTHTEMRDDQNRLPVEVFVYEIKREDYLRRKNDDKIEAKI